LREVFLLDPFLLTLSYELFPKKSSFKAPSLGPTFDISRVLC
jgi:hypothetical protein